VEEGKAAGVEVDAVVSEAGEEEVEEEEEDASEEVDSSDDEVVVAGHVQILRVKVEER
jgi:hypothetical protein